jgi:MurNAc alpha-1-phosphate uridylyltransferase
VADGRVTARGDSYVYCGIAVLDPAALSGRAAEPFSLRDVLFELIRQRALTAQIWRGYWTDIGTIDQLQEVNAYHRMGS